MKISFNQIRKLEPCWSNDKLREYLPTKTRVEVTLQSLQKLTIRDARWLVSRLMTRPQLIVWAQTCAKRAKKYAAWAAAAADADVKENKIAMKHAVALLNGKGMK